MFPFGKAPLVILIVALCSGAGLWAVGARQGQSPDLVFAVFAPNHLQAYERAIAAFEQQHGVQVQLQLVDSRALRSRLQSALQVGADVPDMVELLEGTMGYFTRGPIDEVGFVDLTDRIDAEGLRSKLVESRFSLWSSRGRVFAIPHDVHPVLLAYRRDLVEQLGIDVNTLTTWDRFVAVGREVTRDLNGDGNPDRYMIDIGADGAHLPLLILQRTGHGMFDADGKVAFATPQVAQTIAWYVRQTQGPHRIAFSAGWGQTLAKTMSDGLVLFYFCPDWRSKNFQMDLPHLSGKLALMPMPAWEEGGRRTSTWGGTGLAITKACRNPDLAWALAKYLYFSVDDLGQRYADSNILPPLKDAWSLPEFARANPYYSGQAIGTLYASLAPQTPGDYMSPYTELARGKLSEAYLNTVEHFKTHGDNDLESFALRELLRVARQVQHIMGRNVFLKDAD